MVKIFKNILNYKFILYAGIVTLFVVFIKALWTARAISDPYTQGDWLIHFQDGGFKRRGLSGSFFFFIQDFTNVQLQWLVFIFQLFVIILFGFFLFRLINKKTIEINYILLFFSPVTMLFYVYNPAIIGRKEILLFLIFCLFVSLVSNKAISNTVYNILVVLIAVAAFFHELIIFYVPYFILAKRIFTASSEYSFDIKLGFVVVLVLLCLYFFGSEINNGNSLRILSNRGFVVKKDYCGIFCWDIKPAGYIYDNIYSYATYILSFVYGLILLFLNIRKNKLLNDRNTIKLFGLAIVYSLPLFFLATDWGRWINIHFVLSLIIITAGLNKETTEENISFFPSFIKCLPLLIFNLLFYMKHYKVGFYFLYF